jgi:uncharacterized protein (TIGR03000 family)
MYSVVLMMAMTSGGDVADFGHRHGGCCGGESYSSCCGGSYAYSSCCGGSYSCCGGSYGDCCGGGRHHHRLFGRHHGGCCGGESYGCCGGYSGCCGGYVAPVDCGCGAAVSTGCTGGVVTGGVNAEPIGPGHEAHHVDTGDVKAATLTAEETTWLSDLEKAHPDKKADLEKFCNDPRTTHQQRKDAYEGDKKDGDKKDDGDKKPEDVKKPKSEVMVPAPATIIVSLPANATLTIDDAATTSTASPRVFTSPVLPAGRDFHYTLKAQIVRDGKTFVVSKEVTVRAGETTRATMEAGLASVASR